MAKLSLLELAAEAAPKPNKVEAWFSAHPDVMADLRTLTAQGATATRLIKILKKSFGFPFGESSLRLMMRSIREGS